MCGTKMRITRIWALSLAMLINVTRSGVACLSTSGPRGHPPHKLTESTKVKETQIEKIERR